MNTTEYIASGILEAYVMGSVTPQEKQEVECLSKIYPEIKTELTTLEETLETYAKMHEVKPSEGLKNRIFAEMNFDEQEAELPIEQEEAKTETKVLPLWPKFAVAASVIFGVLFAWSAFNSSKMKSELASLKSKMRFEMGQKAKSEEMLAIYKNPKMHPMELKGVEKSPNSKVMVFYNKEAAEMKLMVENLPDLPKGMQYQVWGIVDGKPMDLGMIAMDFHDKIFDMKLPNKNIQAFAITLEKQGGSPTPTLEEMYVIGNV